jgi:hypothetical protein
MVKNSASSVQGTRGRVRSNTSEIKSHFEKYPPKQTRGRVRSNISEIKSHFEKYPPE